MTASTMTFSSTSSLFELSYVDLYMLIISSACRPCFDMEYITVFCKSSSSSSDSSINAILSVFSFSLMNGMPLTVESDG